MSFDIHNTILRLRAEMNEIDSLEQELELAGVAALILRVAPECPEAKKMIARSRAHVGEVVDLLELQLDNDSMTFSLRDPNMQRQIWHRMFLNLSVVDLLGCTESIAMVLERLFVGISEEWYHLRTFAKEMKEIFSIADGEPVGQLIAYTLKPMELEEESEESLFVQQYLGEYPVSFEGNMHSQSLEPIRLKMTASSGVLKHQMYHDNGDWNLQLGLVDETPKHLVVNGSVNVEVYLDGERIQVDIDHEMKGVMWSLVKGTYTVIINGDEFSIPIVRSKNTDGE